MNPPPLKNIMITPVIRHLLTLIALKMSALMVCRRYYSHHFNEHFAGNVLLSTSLVKLNVLNVLRHLTNSYLDVATGNVITMMLI